MRDRRKQQSKARRGGKETTAAPAGNGNKDIPRRVIVADKNPESSCHSPIKLGRTVPFVRGVYGTARQSQSGLAAVFQMMSSVTLLLQGALGASEYGPP